MRTEVQTSVMVEPAAIVVADTRRRVNESLRDALGPYADLRVTGHCETSQDTCQLLRLRRPDVLLLDWHLPDTGAMTLLGRIKPGPELNIILLTDERDPGILARALILGARGAISRSASAAMLLKCMRAVLDGELWFSRRVTRALRDQITSHGSITSNRPSLEGLLTPRESDVVRSVGNGYTNMEIAEELGISHQTVRHHLKSVFGKLHVSSRLELALLAERDRR